jgi:hypothetical protein
MHGEVVVVADPLEVKTMPSNGITIPPRSISIHGYRQATTLTTIL